MLVKKKCFGKDLFMGEECWFLVKLVSVCVKVCVLKKLKDVVV